MLEWCSRVLAQSRLFHVHSEACQHSWKVLNVVQFHCKRDQNLMLHASLKQFPALLFWLFYRKFVFRKSRAIYFTLRQDVNFTTPVCQERFVCFDSQILLHVPTIHKLYLHMC